MQAIWGKWKNTINLFSLFLFTFSSLHFSWSIASRIYLQSFISTNNYINNFSPKFYRCYIPSIITSTTTRQTFTSTNNNHQSHQYSLTLCMKNFSYEQSNLTSITFDFHIPYKRTEKRKKNRGSNSQESSPHLRKSSCPCNNSYLCMELLN